MKAAQICSYRDAVNVMSKARNVAKGKPLAATGWRMHKDGDEFVIYYRDYMLARILPDNTMRMVCDGDYSVALPSNTSYSVHKVLPVMLMNRGKGYWQLYGVPEGVSRWTDCKGYRLYDGLTIDLTTCKAVAYVEPTLKINSEKRKVWLAKSGELKRYLKTIAKLGGFNARLLTLDKARWRYTTMKNGMTPGDIQIIIDAMFSDDKEILLQRVTETMKHALYGDPPLIAQCKIIDAIFATNSTALRTALGVIETQ